MSTDSRTFSQQDMDDFGIASGGTGLIHTEPDYAAATKFGATLVQGIFLLAVIEKELTERLPGWGVGGSLEAKFVSPVTEGTPFSVDITPEGDGTWSVTARTPNRVAIAATARLARSDAAAD
jgi:acyl dehydratase